MMKRKSRGGRENGLPRQGDALLSRLGRELESWVRADNIYPDDTRKNNTVW